MVTGSRYLVRCLRLRQAFLILCLPGAPARRLQQTALRTENCAARYAALLQRYLVCVCARATCLVTSGGNDSSVCRNTRPSRHALRIRLQLPARRKKCQKVIFFYLIKQPVTLCALLQRSLDLSWQCVCVCQNNMSSDGWLVMSTATSPPAGLPASRPFESSNLAAAADPAGRLQPLGWSSGKARNAESEHSPASPCRVARCADLMPAPLQ